MQGDWGSAARLHHQRPRAHINRHGSSGALTGPCRELAPLSRGCAVPIMLSCTAKLERCGEEDPAFISPTARRSGPFRRARIAYPAQRLRGAHRPTLQDGGGADPRDGARPHVTEKTPKPLGDPYGQPSRINSVCHLHTDTTDPGISLCDGGSTPPASASFIPTDLRSVPFLQQGTFTQAR
ncbi:hypothetical protein SKAU_G00429370 [Synaphobranchus kaupii]|uniref:Uncharacterized protein n=1 Tax=Synaphobranchus kaupii TaxID=118154 RepID=A0A9Q1E4F9_SYNKA|nr:hypothetical protein SKAU_G00429370 [Synaphobranchus kaupii]